MAQSINNVRKDQGQIESLLDVAQEISANRRAHLKLLREALLKDDIDQVVILARKLTGLYDSPTSNRRARR